MSAGRRSQRQRGAPVRDGIGDSVAPTDREGPPGVRVEYCLGGGLDAEPMVERLVGIADDRKRHVVLIFTQFGCGGMKDDDFANACGTDLVDTGDDGTQVQVADRASREPTELQMN